MTSTGLDLVHLQCHMGMDTLSWARRGARVTGLDFSAPAIETAQGLAERIGVDARFVVADVYDAVEVLDATYDITYQSLGSLNWHPDMDRWAGDPAPADPPRRPLLPARDPSDGVGARRRRREGRLRVLPRRRRGNASVDDGGTYADLTAVTTNNETLEFSHTLSDVITALLGAGFVLEQFAEHPFTVFEMWPWLEERPGQTSTWWAPEGRPTLPMMYSLVARKPA